MSAPSPFLLDLQDVQVRFGGILALAGVSLQVRRGSITGLIGPNGAGKTTLFNALCALVPVAGGRIVFDGREMHARQPHEVAAAGVGRTFQNLALLPEHSVFDNVMLGAHARLAGGFFAHLLPSRRLRASEEQARERCSKLLGWLDLSSVADRPVGSLPFGTRKRVELGRALMSQPKLLLLDEPACGLNPAEIAALRELMLDIRTAYDLTVLLIEHHMPLVMGTCEHVEVLNFGAVIGRGRPADVAADPRVVEAYLGAPKQAVPQGEIDAATA